MDADDAAAAAEAGVAEPGAPAARVSNCEPASLALTHTHAADKRRVTGVWTPPSGGAGEVTFYATVVPELASYHVLSIGASAADGSAASATLPQVLLEVAPEAPNAPELVAPTDTTLSLAWHEPENAGPPIEEYTVEVDGVVVDTTDASDGAAARVLTLTDLQPDTEFTIRVGARNNEGWSEFSAPLTASTVPTGSTVPPAPPAPTVSDVAFNSATLNWDGAAEDAMGLPLSNFQLQVAVSAGATGTVDGAVRGGFDGLFGSAYDGPETEAVVDSLNADTAYVARVRSSNVLGYSPWSETSEFRTPDGGDCPLGPNGQQCNGAGRCEVDGTCSCAAGLDGADCSIEASRQCFGEAGDYCIQWAFEDDLVHLQLHARTSGWVGAMFGASDGKMTDGDCIVGWVVPGGGVELQDRYAADFAAPLLDEDAGNGGTAAEFTRVGGFRNSTHTVLSFTRKQDTGDETDFVLTPESGEIAFGWAYAENGSPTFAYHGTLKRGAVRLDLSSGKAAESRNDAALAHGIIMLLAWGFSAPMGALVAYVARVNSGIGSGFFRVQPVTFFKQHRMLQVAAVFLTLVGAVVILVGGRQGFDTPHAWAGLVMIVGCIAQATIGFMWHGDSAHTAHRRLGKGLLILSSVIQIPAGLHAIGWGSVAVSVWVIYIVALITAAIAWRIRRHGAALGLTAAIDAAAAEATAEGRSATPPRGLARFSLGIDLMIRKQFYGLGRFVAKNRCYTVFVAVLVSLICAGGLSQLRTEVRIDKAWVPEGSDAVQGLRSIENNFNELLYDWAEVQLIPVPGEEAEAQAVADGGGGALSKAMLRELFAIQRYVETMEVEVPETGAIVTLADVCLSLYANAGCTIGSPLDYWRNNVEELLADDDIGKTAAGVGYTNAVGTETKRNEVFGSVEMSEDGSRVLRAGALRVVYNIRYLDDASAAWQRAFVEAMHDWPHDVAELHVTTTKSWDDELAAAVDGDTVLFVGLLLAMMAFSTIALGRPHPVASRMMLGLGAIASVLLAILSGFGLAAATGAFWGTTNPIMPFIIVSVGLDDAFIIVGEVRYDLAKRMRTEDIVARALSSAGGAITATSLTGAVAFAMGTLSSIPAVASFCLYAAIAIMTDFALQVTMFVAIVAWDVDRYREGRMDCCTCVSVRAPKAAQYSRASAAEPDADEPLPAGAPVSTPYGSGRVQSVRKDGVALIDLPYGTAYLQPDVVQVDATPTADDAFDAAFAALPKKDSSANRTFRKVYSAALKKPWFRYMSLVAFFVTLVVSVAYTTTVKEGFAGRDIVRDDSYLIPALDVTDLHFSEDLNGVLVVLGKFDYADKANAAEILKLQNRFQEQTNVEITSWYNEFLEWAADEHSTYLEPASDEIDTLVPPANLFYPLLAEWLDTPIIGSAHFKVLRFDESPAACVAMKRWSCVLQESVLYVEVPYIDNARERSDEMLKHRQIMEESPLPGFVFNSDHLTLELNLLIVPETAQNLSLAAVAVCLVGIVFLVHPQPMLFVFVSVLMIDIEVIGLMAAAQINVSPISLIFQIMSIGMVFDYVAHVLHAYSTDNTVDRVERVANAMGSVGPAVAKGVITTALGLMFVSAANSTIFRSMFVIFILVVVLSAAHAFVLIPVVLAMWGTESHALSAAAGAQALLDQEKTAATMGTKPTATTNGGAAHAPNGKAGDVELTAVAVGGAGSAAPVATVKSDRPAKVVELDDMDDLEGGVSKCSLNACKAVYMLMVAIFVLAFVGVTLMSTGTVKREASELVATLVEESDEPFEKTTVMEVTMPDYVVPSDRTSYSCISFRFPMDAQRHAVQFEPIINTTLPPGAPDFSPVHHIVLFSCTGEMSTEPTECWSMPNQCNQIMFAWAVGIQPLELPPNVGMAVGKATDNHFMAMQMHYE